MERDESAPAGEPAPPATAPAATATPTGAPAAAVPATERAPKEQAATEHASPAAEAAPARVGIPAQRPGPRRGTRAAEPATDATDADRPETAGGPEIAADAEAPASGAGGRAIPAKKAPSKAAKKAAPAKKAASKAAKKTAAKKAAPRKAAAREAAPADPAPPTDLPPTDPAPTDPPPTDPAPERVAPAPAGPPELTLWDRLRSDPAHVPEVLALTAVERLGPEAARYTGWVRATYPGATDDRLAQAAGRRFAAQARSAALAGMIAPEVGQLVALVTLGWLQARLVLHVAAAYGRDPSAAERAAELLVLLRVHDDLPTARDALATARDNGVPLRRPARRLLSVGARGAGRRLAARLIPGAGVLVDLLVNDASIEAVTRRAIGYYRTPPAPVSPAPSGTAEGP